MIYDILYMIYDICIFLHTCAKVIYKYCPYLRYANFYESWFYTRSCTFYPSWFNQPNSSVQFISPSAVLIHHQLSLASISKTFDPNSPTQPLHSCQSLQSLPILIWAHPKQPSHELLDNTPFLPAMS